MMKKFLFFISIIYLSITSVALAFPNEPTGFRGLEWGSSIEEFKQKYPNDFYEIDISTEKKEINELLGDLDNKLYGVLAENNSISGVPIYSPIKYHFWSNQLDFIQIGLGRFDITETYNVERRLLSALETLYGECTKKYVDGTIFTNDGRIANMYFWKGDKTIISLFATYRDKNKYHSSLLLTIASKEIQDKRSEQIEINMQSKAKQGW